ncbi:MAG TPA: glycerol-3-phosphate dehydrogenase [Dongiaceae bacterium]|nr:glycerol-3-phosphate dehydrogenase [Dongiaceae bacterium]
MARIFDIAIIGGGINGCGIARDAAGRGLSVYLCEQADLASGTSSASTKLIHGGLRYLEYYEFRLVREALQEREVLWRAAPHIVSPLRFVLPHHQGLRPAWLLRLGLFLYDHLGGRRLLPATRVLDLRTDPAGAPLKAGDFAKAFEYSDCWVDDARLVVLNAIDAARHGADIRTRTRAISAERRNGSWLLTTEHAESGVREEIHARTLVNAAGPWVARTLSDVAKVEAKAGIRLVQGSHIVVPKLFDHGRCYMFQNTDGRIVFAIPYEQDFTLIGTTDQDYHGDLDDIRASAEEIAYLCSVANGYFARQITPGDVVWTYSGVRPLYDDGASAAQAATRDYVLAVDAPDEQPALLSVFGGKITTYRRLAEHALEKLDPFLGGHGGRNRGWTGREPLPGGEFPVGQLAAQIEKLMAQYGFLPRVHAARLVRMYGTRARDVLGTAQSAADLGRDFGATLTEAEIDYLMREEWAEIAADVLWRRSKLGLRLNAEQAAAVDAAMAARRRNAGLRPEPVSAVAGGIA